MPTNTLTVSVTGAAGQIGYSLLFRLASGEVFGPKQKIRLQLLERPERVRAAEGVALELEDCAFGNLESIDCFDSAEQAFSHTHWALLVGSKPRGSGMERRDLLKANGLIFLEQGKALRKADASVRVVVVGNPCNTNALIAQHNCKEIPPTRFFAMTALDENRAKAAIAKKLKISVNAVTQAAIWGNHSPTMYPDYENILIEGEAAPNVLQDHRWFQETFIPSVQRRGAEIIAARGKSSAASAASACVDTIKRLISPTQENDWYSVATPSNGGHYDIPKGLVCSVPARTDRDGNVSVVEGVELSNSAKKKILISINELLDERDMVKDLLM